MIGYYISCGDEQVCEVFTPYVWDKYGFDTLLKSKLQQNYGNDMSLLLIQYYVEGEFSSYLPEQPKVGNYMKKSKDIIVAIGVTREVFHDKDEFQRREFIIDSTIDAIKLVKGKLIKKKLDIDFDKLMSDVQEVAAGYLTRAEPYSSN